MGISAPLQAPGCVSGERLGDSALLQRTHQRPQAGLLRRLPAVTELDELQRAAWSAGAPD